MAARRGTALELFNEIEWIATAAETRASLARVAMLRCLQVMCGLDNRTMSKQFDVTPVTVSRWRNGTTRIPRAVLLSLYLTLDCAAGSVAA